eukprot:11154943-Lingulodinium_polyedra.AAC.1
MPAALWVGRTESKLRHSEMAATCMQEQGCRKLAGCKEQAAGLQGCRQEASNKQATSYNQPFDLYHKSMCGRAQAAAL